MIIGCRLVSRKYHIGPFKHRLNKKSCPRKALAKSAMTYCDTLRLCHCFVANGATQAPTFMNCSHEKLLLIQQSDADALPQQTFCRLFALSDPLLGKITPAIQLFASLRRTGRHRLPDGRGRGLQLWKDAGWDRADGCAPCTFLRPSSVPKEHG